MSQTKTLVISSFDEMTFEQRQMVHTMRGRLRHVSEKYIAVCLACLKTMAFVASSEASAAAILRAYSWQCKPEHDSTALHCSNCALKFGTSFYTVRY